MKAIPTAAQLRFMDWELGAFFHFGIRSFFMGHADWDHKPMPAAAFAPDQLDCGQWLRAAKAMGARYAILTCKHHDGFANWPSRLTAYSVAASPCKIDVVRAFTDACRAAGLKTGLYYSPAQWGGDQLYTDDRAYDDYFIGQLSELLTGYGTIDYLWLDGCGSAGHHYDHRRITAEIRRLQPNILIMGSVLHDGTDVRWIGNEDGFAPAPNFNDMNDPAFTGPAETAQLGARRFLPAECDMMLRDTWFDCADNVCALATPAALMGHYEATVGRGANLLINAGPNRHGLLNDADVRAMAGLGEKIRAWYGAPLDYLPFRAAGEQTWQLDHRSFAGEGAPWAIPLCNRVSIQEDLTQGEHARAFALYGHLPRAKGQRILLFRGDSIGHRRICAFPAIRASRLTLEVTAADGACAIRDLRAYYAGE